MTTPVKQFTRVPGVGAWFLDDFLLLSALGILPYRKRYSKIYYVNPDTSIGSDRNQPEAHGLPFDRPLNTIEAALSYVISGQGDFIIIQPSSTNITEGDISVAKTDLVICGMTPAHMGGVILKPTTDPSTAILACTAASNRIVLKNLQINGAGDGGNDVVGINVVGLANYVDGFLVEGCRFVLCGNGIVTSNAGSAADWVIRKNAFLNCDNGIKGYFHHGLIEENLIVKTLTTALTVGIELLDNTITADSDGCIINRNIVLGGIEGTTPMADGIKVAAACYGVGGVDNRVSGCTTNVTLTDNSAGAHAIFNITGDGRQGGGEWVNAETYLHAVA